MNKKPIGFAKLSPKARKERAAIGGSSVPKHKRSFSQDNQLAAEAGRKGGIASVEAKRRRKQESMN